jgi:hypothetical protein
MPHAPGHVQRLVEVVTEASFIDGQPIIKQVLVGAIEWVGAYARVWVDGGWVCLWVWVNVGGGGSVV